MRRVLLLVCLFVVPFQTGRAQELFGRAEDVVPQDLESMYIRGIRYLVATQTATGSWSDQNGQQPGVVGLAVLAMLAHGEDPNAGPYSTAIKRGLDYILKNANSSNGYLGTSMYNHGFATLALAEAYGAVDDARLGPALKKAVELILTSQNNNPTGGWRYSPESRDADTTVSGAQVVALLAARNAGIAVPDTAIQKALKFYESCQCGDGGIGYTSANGSGNVRTAIGVLVMELARRKDTTTFKSAFRYLAKEPFRDDNYPFYFHYYAAQSFFHADAQSWTAWNVRNIKNLAVLQSANGNWDGNQGPVFSTAMALLSVALNYRYLPIYER